MPEIYSTNFQFLADCHKQLANTGGLAERYFHEDPNTSLIKLRQFAELLTNLLAANYNLYKNEQESQADLLRRLRQEGVIYGQVNEAFHQLRILGNKAVHDHRGTPYDALTAMKLAFALGKWFYQSLGYSINKAPASFTPPTPPADANSTLMDEINRLKEERNASLSELERLKIEAEESKKALRAHEAEQQILQQRTLEYEASQASLKAELEKIQSKPRDETKTKERSQFSDLNLDERTTRILIDQQLRDSGWTVDSLNLTYKAGTRPSKGQAIAIAEWPTETGPADYALFIDTKCFAIVEAKKRNKNVSAAIDQAQRYSRGVRLSSNEKLCYGAPWADGQSTTMSEDGLKGLFQIPFVFSTNGRPYLKQLETESGIWFRDVRLPKNQRRALAGWFTPEGLKAEFELDRQNAQEKLKTKSFEFGFPLRPYQRLAIEEVEKALEGGQREMLLAMATGTGKTKLAIALMYRLLDAQRFRRICFVVDREALGTQSATEFKTTKVVSAKTFADTFGLKGLEEKIPDSETKVHICTIQGLVRRVLYETDQGQVPPIDQYDLMIVDECHRGYTLDRELSEAELEFRSEEDYISKYRRVLEYFDAVKIGLTATPALHTAEIFGKPIYTYSYREAVIDGYLIDHEPPIQIETELSQSGITFKGGSNVSVLDTKTGLVDSWELPDEVDLHYDKEAFNRKVITPQFNAAVSEGLAKYIDPMEPGKTLIFASTDGHADLVVDKLKNAMREQYGEVEDAMIRKITGSVDKRQELILQFRNDSWPKIAVTVDLLTTGVDVPSITNLVFLRRVSSRILYEQMLGRATRPCPEINKEVFRIFDAVALYEGLKDISTMKPVVVNPKISFSQLLKEFQNTTDPAHLAEIRDQIVAKLARKSRNLKESIEQEFIEHTGESVKEALERFRNEDLTSLVNWTQSKPKAGAILDWTSQGGGTFLPISDHDDKLLSITTGYGNSKKPEDYLESFTVYIREHVNQIAALTAVVQRPRDLTRKDLKELRLMLEHEGFKETYLNRAWLETKNEDIAASIIGFIRQAALGDPLVPYEERVHKAIRKLESSRNWTPPQRKWLKRIGEQFEKEILVDREALDSGQFKQDAGGYNRLNRVFEGQLENILGDIQDEIWRNVS